MLSVNAVLAVALVAPGGSWEHPKSSLIEPEHSETRRSELDHPPFETRNQKSSATFINRSRRGVVAVCGTFDYQTESGTIQTADWDYVFTGPLVVDNPLPPDRAYVKHAVPVHGRRGEYLQFVVFRVTGVAYDNGETWGPDGEYCSSKVADGARAARMQIAELERMASAEPERFEAEILGPVPLVPGYRAEVVHNTLKRMLTDSNGDLRPDYRAVLRDLLDRLRQF